MSDRAVFGLDASQWPLGAQQVRTAAAEIERAVQTLGTSRPTGNGIDAEMQRLVASLGRTVEVVRSDAARINSALAEVGKGGSIGGLGLDGIGTSVQTALNQALGHFGRFASQLKGLGIGDTLSSELTSAFAKDFAASMDQVQREVQSQIRTAAQANRTNASRFINAPPIAVDAFGRQAVDAAARAPGGLLAPTAPAALGSAARVFAGIRADVEAIGRSTTPAVFGPQAVASAREMASLSRQVKDALFTAPEVAGPRGGKPRTFNQFLDRSTPSDSLLADAERRARELEQRIQQEQLRARQSQVDTALRRPDVAAGPSARQRLGLDAVHPEDAEAFHHFAATLREKARALDALDGLGPASKQLIAAEREAIARLRSQSALAGRDVRSGAYDRLLSDIHGGGVGGGAGGRGGAGGPGGTPSDAFFGGLTSRGFGSTSRGDLLNNVSASFGSAVKFTALYSAIGAGTGAVAKAKAEVVDYVDSLTDAAIALDVNRDSFDSYRQKIDHEVVPSLEKLSRLTGENVGASLDAYARGVRAFTETTDPADQRSAAGVDFAKQATQLSVITGGDIKDKTGDLIAIGKAFGFANDQLSQVVDAVSNARQTGGDLDQISQGLANLASVAPDAGLSLQEAANLIGAVSAKTDQSGTLVATRIGRFSQIIANANNQKLLSRYGVDTSGGLLQQLGQLNTGLQGSSPQEKKAVVARLAGTANVREFNVALAEANELIKKSEDDLRNAGAGADLFGKKNADLAGLFRKINGDISNIIVNLQRAETGTALGLGLQAFERVLQVVDHITGLLASMPDLLGQAIFGAAGLYATFKLGAGVLERFRASRAVEPAAPLFLGSQRAALTPLETAGVAGAAGAAGARGPAAAAAARAAASSVVAPGIAAQIALERELTTALLQQGVAAEQVAVSDLAVARTKKAIAVEAIAAAEAELRLLGIQEGSVATTEAQVVALANLVRAREAELALTAEAGAAGETLNGIAAQRIALMEGEGIRLAELNAANGEAIRIQAALAASYERTALAAGTAATSETEAAVASNRRGLGGLLASPKGIGVLIAATVAFEVARSAKESSKRRTEARDNASAAIFSIGGAEDTAALEKSVQSARTAVKQVRDSQKGFFGGLQDRTERLIGGDGANRRADFLQKEADAAQARLDESKKQQRAAAAAGGQGVFRDTTLDGIKEGLEQIKLSGGGATAVLNAITKELYGIGKSKGDIGVGERRAFEDQTLSLFGGGPQSKELQQTYAELFGDSARGVSRNVRLRGALQDGGPDDLLSGGDPALKAAEKLLDPKAIAKREKELAGDPGGLEKFRGEVDAARLEIAKAYLEQRLGDPKKQVKLQEDLRSALSHYLTDHGVTDNKASNLSDDDQEGAAELLAQIRVDSDVALAGLSSEARERAKQIFKREYLKRIQSQLDPTRLDLDDQQATLAAQAFNEASRQRESSVQFGDADQVITGLTAKRKLDDLRRQRASRRSPLRPEAKVEADAELDRQIAEQEKIFTDAQDGERARTPLEAARGRLDRAQAQFDAAIAAGRTPVGEVVQELLEARRDFAERTLEQADALAHVFTRSRADQARQAVDAAKRKLADAKAKFGSNPNAPEIAGAQYELDAAQAGQDDLAFAKDIARLQSTVDPRSAASKARVQLQVASANLQRARDLFTENSEEFSNALREYQDAQFAMAQQAVDDASATRALLRAPGDSVGKAVDTVQDLVDQRSLTAPGSTEFKRIQAQLNQAQFAQAQAFAGRDSSARRALGPVGGQADAANALKDAQQSLQLALQFAGPGTKEFFDALAAYRQAQIQFAQAQLENVAAARDALSPPGQVSEATNQLQSAADQLNLAARVYGPGSTEFYKALSAYRQAQIQLAQAQLENLSAQRDALSFPGSVIQGAANDLQNATEQLDLAARVYGPSSTEFFKALAAYHQALEAFAEAQDQAIVTRYKLGSGINDPIVNASADLFLAQQKLSRLQAAGAPQEDQDLARLQIRQAELAQAQAFAERDSAKRALGVTPGSDLGAARAALEDAKQAVDIASQHQGTDSAAYYQALTNLRRAQFDLAAAERDAAKTKLLLSGDITNPLVQAQAEVAAARKKLQDDLAAGASSDVTDKDRLDLRTAEANQEATAFQQRFSAAQTADQLGRISHAQYIKYLQNEKARLESIKDRTYQQQQQLDQIDLALKAARDQFSGQFNLGDIKLPTPYEVRRYIKEQGGGSSVSAGFTSPGSFLGGSTLSLPFGDQPLDTGGFARTPESQNPQTSGAAVVNNYFTIDGADVGMITSIINQAVSGGITNYTNAPKKV